MEVECIRSNITSGTHTYPVYMGFLTAEQVARVAEAPSFTLATPHQQIALNVSSQPVRDWQRPLDQQRVQGIADTFDDTGELMPNPILVSENAFVNGRINLRMKRLAGGGEYTGTWQVEIDETNIQGGQRPLWILDGQHRIAGLAKSAQRVNPVPVVFLLNGGGGSYSPPLLAELFAQVTTSAAKLDDLHNEWLTYAFQLGAYTSSGPAQDSHQKAFATVIELCRQPTLGGNPNPFLNAIQFNEHLGDHKPKHGGFTYKCTTLKDLILKHYYGQPAVQPHLAPDDLAVQLAGAYSDLYSAVGHQKDTVFFGSTQKQQTVMQDAYFVGVLTRVLKHGVQVTWSTLLQALRFPESDWDFSWVSTLSGPANTVSKRVAIQVLSDALDSGQLPTRSQEIPDHLRGNGAEIRAVFSAVTPTGRPKKATQVTTSLYRGDDSSQPAVQYPHVRIARPSSNVGKIEAFDATMRGKPVEYPKLLKKGLLLTHEPGLPNPLAVEFVMHHYGGLQSSAVLRIKW